MVRLLEHEGKALLGRCGIAVPHGCLWPALPEDTGGGMVVKAQTRSGGRGKRRGVRFASTPQEAAASAESLLADPLGEERVEAVWVEERLDIVAELYAAAMVDRDAGQPVLLTGRRGGVEVEHAAGEETGSLARASIAGRGTVREGAVRHLVAHMVAEQRRHREELTVGLGNLLRRLAAACVREDALLVEINPLVVTASGRIVAADARVVLDDAAWQRHPDWPPVSPEQELASVLAPLGASGTELEGDVAVVVSGAGLLMATIDELALRGISCRAAVDLGAAMFTDAATLGAVFDKVLNLQPRALLVSSFLQLTSPDALASGLLEALAACHYPREQVTVRLAGAASAAARWRLRELTPLTDADQALDRLAAALAGLSFPQPGGEGSL
ncbi:MAG: ATP-grasp domain-containing protein [Egibacteraceae bacterium]